MKRNGKYKGRLVLVLLAESGVGSKKYIKIGSGVFSKKHCV